MKRFRRVRFKFLVIWLTRIILTQSQKSGLLEYNIEAKITKIIYFDPSIQ